MNIEINEYGFSFNFSGIYLSLDWIAIITIAVVVIAYKFYKRKKNK